MAEVRRGRGGHGGSAEISGGTGIAIGGNGGRGGVGNGGDGGAARVVGGGLVRGGDGGDAARPGRPALGARSPLSVMRFPAELLPQIVDTYGIPQPGKGGDSYFCSVVSKGKTYSLNIILQLMDGYSIRFESIGSTIDKIDQEFHNRNLKSEQQWWDLALKMFPGETDRVIKYMDACESVAD